MKLDGKPEQFIVCTKINNGKHCHSLQSGATKPDEMQGLHPSVQLLVDRCIASSSKSAFRISAGTVLDVVVRAL